MIIVNDSLCKMAFCFLQQAIFATAVFPIRVDSCAKDRKGEISSA